MGGNSESMTRIKSKKLDNNDNAGNNNFSNDKNNKEMINISIIFSAGSKSNNIKCK